MTSRVSNKVISVAVLAVATTAACLWRVGMYAKQYFAAMALLAKYKVNMTITHSTAMALQAEFRHQMEDGLARKPLTRLLMLPSFVTKIPDGSETGEYLALDLGGTSLKLLHIVLGKGTGEVVRSESREVEIPEAVYRGTTDGVFEFLASSLVDFARAEGLVPAGEAVDSAQLPPVGFCFSFPMHQRSVDSGSLVRWTKGFRIHDGVGCDPAAQLHAALQRRGFPARVASLLNDTIGVFAAACYEHPDAAIGLILGTGTNACYVESISAVKAMSAANGAGGKTVVNTEWGDFDSPLIPRCEEDRELDAASVRPGQMVFEKLVSGMYLGEIVRRILLTLVRESGLLDPSRSSRLDVPESLSTAMMAAIDHDDSMTQETVITTLMLAFGLSRSDCSWTLCSLAKQVVELVADRAARLVALGLCALLAQLNSGDAASHRCIAVDGTLYKKYDKLRERIQHHVRYYQARGSQNSSQNPAGSQACLAALATKDDAGISFVECMGGSCVGAAVVAAAVARS